MTVLVAIKMIVVGAGVVTQPSFTAKFVTSAASTQVLMFKAKLAISSITTIAVSQIFLSKTAARVSTRDYVFSLIDGAINSIPGGSEFAKYFRHDRC